MWCAALKQSREELFLAFWWHLEVRERERERKSQIGYWERKGKREKVVWTTARKEGRWEVWAMSLRAFSINRAKFLSEIELKAWLLSISISLLSANKTYTDKALRLCSIIFHAIHMEYIKVLLSITDFHESSQALWCTGLLWFHVVRSGLFFVCPDTFLSFFFF